MAWTFLLLVNPPFPMGFVHRLNVARSACCKGAP
jgi:hypothetical protein